MPSMDSSAGGKFVHRDDLIIDFGMHHGLDTLFYLQKGFKVVAIEANPQMVEIAKETLKQYLKSGQLIIEAVGIGPERGTFKFYRHLENDEWSTFDAKIASTRPPHEEIEITCVTPEDIFAKHGIPYYAKIDIEGLDMCVVNAFASIGHQPKTLSVENGPPDTMVGLYNAGWRKFKFINMREIWRIELPNPPLEGKFVERQFAACSSGPFGEELPGEWLSFHKAMHYYFNEVNNPYNPRPDIWFDIHCMM